MSGLIPSRFFVGGIADNALGEKLVLVVEGDKGIFDESLLKGLDKYDQPKEIYYNVSFLETDNGKVKRNEILKSLIQ